MKRETRRLPGAAVAFVIVALTVPAVHAQCASAREVAMASNGETHGRIGVDTQFEIPLANDQNEVATFWVTGNAYGNNSGGPHFGTPSTCPSSTGLLGDPWWLLGGTGDSQPPDARSIRFFIASTGCTLMECPPAGASITVLVEDQTADGRDAGFITYTADETPGPIRWWDLARTDPDSQPSNDVTHGMWAFPRVEVTASWGPPPYIEIMNDYRDPAVNVWVVGAAGPLPASTVIDSFDILSYIGPSDPGRERSHWWLMKSIPYANAGIVGDIVPVFCGSPLYEDMYVAVGLTFDGVPSYYVGKSVQIECGPNLADPEKPTIRPRDRLGREPRGRAGR